MSKDWKSMAKAVNENAGALYKASPDVMRAFSELTAAATSDSALSKKLKELMAVAVSVSIRCDGCVAYHTQAAIKLGASREEFVEAVNVAIEMGGGPSTVYGAEALEAYDQLVG